MSTALQLRGHAWLVVAIAAVACGPASTSGSPRTELAPVPSTPASFDVEVGTGATDFVALADGDPIDLTYGSQGGFHIWTSVRIRDATIQEATVNVSSRFEVGGAAAGSPSGWAAAPALVGGDRVQLGMRNIIDQPSAVTGRRIILRAEVVARDGRHGAGERVVVPR
jgi:hypothetical protein